MRNTLLLAVLCATSLTSTMAFGQSLPTEDGEPSVLALSRSHKSKGRKVGPRTKLTLPVYQHGKKTGERKTTVREFWQDMDGWEDSQADKHGRDQQGPGVQHARVFDEFAGGVIDQVSVPQDVPQRILLAEQEKAAPLWRPSTEVRPRKLRTSMDRTFGNNSTFGAFLKGSFEAEGDSRGASVRQEFSAGGFVFGTRITLLSQSAKLSSEAREPVIDVKVLDDTVFLSRSPVLAEDKSFTRARDARRVFVVGIIPISVKGRVSGAMGVNFDYGLRDNRVAGSISPFVNTRGTASAGIDFLFARAGVEGSLTFVDDTLTSNFGASLNNRRNKLRLSLDVSNRIRVLSGKIAIFATIRRLFRPDRKFSKTLFSFDGITTTDSLLERKITVRI